MPKIKYLPTVLFCFVLPFFQHLLAQEADSSANTSLKNISTNLFLNINSCSSDDYILTAYYAKNQDDYYAYDYRSHSMNADRQGLDLRLGLRQYFQSTKPATRFFVQATVCNILHGFLAQKHYSELTRAYLHGAIGFVTDNAKKELEFSTNFFSSLGEGKYAYAIALILNYNRKYGKFQLGGALHLSYLQEANGLFKIEKFPLDASETRAAVSFRITGPGSRVRPYFEIINSARLFYGDHFYSPTALTFFCTGIQLQISPDFLPVNESLFLSYPKYYYDAN